MVLNKKRETKVVSCRLRVTMISRERRSCPQFSCTGNSFFLFTLDVANLCESFLGTNLKFCLQVNMDLIDTADVFMPDNRKSHGTAYPQGTLPDPFHHHKNIHTHEDTFCELLERILTLLQSPSDIDLG